MYCFLAGKKQCTVDNERGPHFWRGLGEFGGPGRDRTGDLFHAMEARSQLRHRPTLRRDGAKNSGTSFILSQPSSLVKPSSRLTTVNRLGL